MPKRVRSMFAWVPLPLPGAPYKSRFTPHSLTLSPQGRGDAASPYEAAVLAHDQLRLQLLHSVQRHTDHDQDRRASEIHLLMWNARDLGGGDGQDHGDEAQEARARERDSVHNRRQVVRGRAPRPDAWNEARVSLEVAGHLGDLECDRRIEVCEGDREREVE